MSRACPAAANAIGTMSSQMPVAMPSTSNEKSRARTSQAAGAGRRRSKSHGRARLSHSGIGVIDLFYPRTGLLYKAPSGTLEHRCGATRDPVTTLTSCLVTVDGRGLPFQRRVRHRQAGVKCSGESVN